METLTLAEAKERYRGASSQIPRVIYSSYGDYLGVIIDGEPYLTERIDEFFTLHRGRETGRVVGCTIKGLSAVARSVIAAYEAEEHETIALKVVFYAISAVTGTFSRHYCEFPLPDVQIPSSAFVAALPNAAR